MDTLPYPGRTAPLAQPGRPNSSSPSPSMSLSQASPSPLLSVSRWSLLGTLGQLSQASPKESVSEFCWSLLGKSRQLSCGEEDGDVGAVVVGRQSHSGQGRKRHLQHSEATPKPAAPQEKHLEALRTEPKGEALLEPLQHSHLHILDTISISIIVTLVPNAIVVSILLPRIGRQAAVVLQARHSQH